MSNSRTWYARAKGQTAEQDTGSGTGTVASTRPATPAVVKEEVKDAVEESVVALEGLKLEEVVVEEKGTGDLAWTPIEETTEGSKGESRDTVIGCIIQHFFTDADTEAEATSGPSLLFQQAEQIYVAASHGQAVTSAAFPETNGTAKPIPLGPASFLTIDFQVWEEEYGVVLDVGWSGCWFEGEVVGEDKGVGSWQEQRMGGHWM
jgi:hypothetical protein